MDNEKILVVDDDEKICQILSLYLRSKGYEVATCKNGANAIAAFETEKPDLVLLDIMLPGMDGWEILSRLRTISAVPVIMLTAKGDTPDRILGLDRGADDYIVKPFDSKELVARIRAVFRRAGAVPEKEENNSVITGGDIEIDLDKHTVSRNGRVIEMPHKEFELLVYLVQNKGQVLTRGKILNTVWGFEFAKDSRTIDVHIKRLRSRLGDSSTWQIITVWGVGYKFVESGTQSE